MHFMQQLRYLMFKIFQSLAGSIITLFECFPKPFKISECGDVAIE